MKLSLWLADKLRMIHSEMAERMSSEEFYLRIAYYSLTAPPETSTTQEQTPEQILATLDFMAFKQRQRRAN